MNAHSLETLASLFVRLTAHRATTAYSSGAESPTTTAAATVADDAARAYPVAHPSTTFLSQPLSAVIATGSAAHLVPTCPDASDTSEPNPGPERIAEKPGA